jgi:two-component sensor histidine kinase
MAAGARRPCPVDRAVTAWYLFFTPVRSFDVPDVSTAGPLVGFLIVGSLRLNLLINDDGPGMAPQAVDANVKSLGIGLMEAFATQLGGSLKIAGGEGASLSVAFETGRAA